jgi:2-oxoglutarate dehydrogenase E2 component (dihydrolipoamide succinyltransferase)
VRRKTGAHMVHSLATSPHAWITYELDYDSVSDARREVGPGWRDLHGGRSLTYLPFLCFAVCRALERYPEVNARLNGDELELHDRVGLGIAVDLGPRGLVVPVISDADRKDVGELAVEIADLADRARGRRLTERDLVGGTYTVTNPGPAGTFSSSPIINQPQAAILAVDGIAARAVVRRSAEGTDELAIGVRGLVTQAFDHRAFDGAYCAGFLRELADIVRTTSWRDRIR